MPPPPVEAASGGLADILIVEGNQQGRCRVSSASEWNDAPGLNRQT